MAGLKVRDAKEILKKKTRSWGFNGPISALKVLAYYSYVKQSARVCVQTAYKSTFYISPFITYPRFVTPIYIIMHRHV